MIKIAIFSQIAGVILHSYLTFMHYGLKTGTIAGKSLCSISSKFNCEAVSLSPFSALLGAPLSLWGAFFNFVIFLFLIGHVINNESKNSFFKWAYSLSLFSVISSVFMGTLSITQMDVFCLFCIFLYILSFITAVALYMDPSKPKFISGADIASLKNQKSILFGILAIPALTLLINDMNMRSFNKAVGSIVVSSIENWIQNPVQDFSAFTGIKKGASDENAKFKIIEFADYQCPHCLNASSTLGAFVYAHKDVQLTFYPFPLDGSCNPVVTHSDGGLRCLLAKAVLCADKQGQGWATNDWIFEHFYEKSELTLDNIINNLKLDANLMKACVESTEIASAIRINGEKGQEVGVQGTPTVFVNGKKLDGGQILKVLESLYKHQQSN